MYQAIYFGASLNPTTYAHNRIVRKLATICNRLFVSVCGPRDDKMESSRILLPTDREAVALLGFGEDLPKNVSLDVADLSRCHSGIRTSTYEQLCSYREIISDPGSYASIRLAVGADLVKGGLLCSQICNGWINGERLWREFGFIILRRPGYEIDEGDYPPVSDVLMMDEMPQSSKDARKAAACGDRTALLQYVNEQSADYILSRGLYCAS